MTTFRAPCTIITLRELRHWPPCVNPLLPRMRSWVCRQFRRSVSSLFDRYPPFFPSDTREIGLDSNRFKLPQSPHQMDNDHATSCERTGERELNKNKVVNPRDSPERGREENQGESTLSLRIFWIGMGGKRGGGGGGGLNRIGRTKKLNSLRLCSRWCQPVWPRQHLPLPSRTAFRPEQRKRNEGHLKNSWHPVENDSTPDTSQGSPLFPPFPTATTTPRRPQAINEQRLGLLFFPKSIPKRIASIREASLVTDGTIFSNPSSLRANSNFSKYFEDGKYL